MFKNIQKTLLLKYPLLWNTKFIPMIAIGLLLHIIFFGLGYIDGTIDFSNRNNIDIKATSIMFGVLIIIVIFILWLVNYLKNNSLKSFYSKSKYSLFYELMQIFTIILLLITFYIPFSVAKQWHQKSYFSLEETTKRCKTISTADYFIDGSFAQTELDSLASGLIDSLGNVIQKEKTNQNYNNPEYAVEAVEMAGNGYVRKDYILFKGKKYDEYSLLNRNTFDFSVISNEQDSLNRIEVKTWLFNNNAGAVQKLQADYLKLIQEHNLATNLTANKWFEITYKAPEFYEYLFIQPYLREYETEDSYSYNNYDYAVKVRDGEKKYSKYFVQQDVLKKKYDTVSDAHTEDFFDFEAILAFLYGALGLALLVFSFRVTSGKSWLIAIVITGVLNIIYGIFAALASGGNLYFYLMLFTIIGIILYFFFIYFSKKSIQYSRLALNLFLWSFVAIIPLIYFLIQDFYKKEQYRFDYSYYESPEYKWLKEHVTDMFTINFIVAIIVLFILSKIIRNWKGLAED
ncbi:MAG: nucleoporin NDC1 [Flavobacterium sp.]|nr:nucleoporin NDC1 [Flavobacterium sp.]